MLRPPTKKSQNSAISTWNIFDLLLVTRLRSHTPFIQGWLDYNRSSDGNLEPEQKRKEKCNFTTYRHWASTIRLGVICHAVYY
jgi:hypothetical protein